MKRSSATRIGQLSFAGLFFVLTSSALSQSVISFDFNRNSDEVFSAGQSAGAVASQNWTQSGTLANGSASNLVTHTGAATTASITWSSGGTWAAGSANGNSGQVKMFKGYLDDGGAGPQVTISSVPFTSYSVLLYFQSDQGGGTANSNVNYRAYSIDGQYYAGTTHGTVLATSGSTFAGEGVFGAPMEEGRNYLRVDGLTNETLSIAGQSRSGTNRGSITGLQIVDTSNFVYWDLNGNTAGAGGSSVSGTWDSSSANWNLTHDGTGTTSAWTNGKVAAFSAGSDATGASTITVSGTQIAEGLWFSKGNVTLSGGTIELGSAQGAAVFVTSGSTATIQSAITGSNGLTVNGPGNLILSGANTYTGATQIRQGNTTITNTAGLSNGSAVSIESFANLELNYNANATLSNTIQGYGTLIKSGTGNLTLTAGGANRLSNQVVVNEGTLTLTSGSFAGDVLTGNGLLTINSNGTVVIGAAHALGGSNLNVGGDSIAINGGTLTLNAEQYAGNLQMTGGTINGTNELRTTGTGTTLQINASPNTANINSRLNATYSALNLNVADGGAAVDLNVTGDITGNQNVNKNGAGTMVYSGTQTNSAQLNVNDGKLVFNGTKSGTGDVNVGANGTLAGTGSIAGTTNVAGQLQIGSDTSSNLFGTGTLTFLNDLNLNAGSQTTFNFNQATGNVASLNPLDIANVIPSSGSQDFLNVAGEITANGLFTLILGDGVPLNSGDYFDLLTSATGGISSGDYSFNLPSLQSGLSWDTSAFSTQGILLVVPEPGRVIFLAGSLLPFVIRRRRSAI